jgi:hypothetical protein
MNFVGKSTTDLGYVQVLRLVADTRQMVLSQMADHRVDAFVYDQRRGLGGGPVDRRLSAVRTTPRTALAAWHHRRLAVATHDASDQGVRAVTGNSRILKFDTQGFERE